MFCFDYTVLRKKKNISEALCVASYEVLNGQKYWTLDLDGLEFVGMKLLKNGRDRISSTKFINGYQSVVTFWSDQTNADSTVGAYGKVASSNTPCLEPHLGFYRLRGFFIFIKKS